MQELNLGGNSNTFISEDKHFHIQSESEAGEFWNQRDKSYLKYNYFYFDIKD